MASDQKKLAANACSKREQPSAALTVSPELSQLLQRTTEFAAAAMAVSNASGAAERFANAAAGTSKGEEEQNRDGPSSRRGGSGRPGSATAATGGSASLRLRRLPSSRCPSCSGAPFTDATFEGYRKGDCDDDDFDNKALKQQQQQQQQKQPRRSPSEIFACFLAENGRSLSAPLLALLVAAASVTWSLYEYAGSSAAALGGPALYAAKACVATSQASFGMVFLPVSRGLVTTLRATSLRRIFDFDSAIKYHVWLAIIGAVAGTLHGVRRKKLEREQRERGREREQRERGREREQGEARIGRKKREMKERKEKKNSSLHSLLLLLSNSNSNSKLSTLSTTRRSLSPPRR